MQVGRIHLLLVILFSAPHAIADEKINIPMPEGKFIETSLRVPKGCPSGTRFPVILVFGGFVEAGWVLDLLHLQEPIILASFDYPYRGDRKFPFPKILLDAGKLREAVRLTQEGISRLVPLLRDRKDVDPERIAIVGASFGAPFAVHAAAVSPDLSALIIVHGFGDIRGTIRHRLATLWAKSLGRLTDLAAGLVASVITLVLNPPMPEKDAKMLKASQNVLLVEAMADTFIPPHSREVLWQGFSESAARVERVQMPGEHLRPGSTALIESLIELSVNWLKRIGWLKRAQKCSG